MTAVDPTFLALQTALAGRFSLEREIGRGGMGLVYLARDVLLERPVAIKLLAPALAAGGDMRRRFLREARIAAQCFHPNIVPIHEVAEQGDLAWFVMGYVRGDTLADRLRRAGPLSVEHIRRIGREIGWALSYAHERGVVHRDVKPENILLEQGTDRALIADFGIAVGEHGPLVSGEVAGTARFMAPEQALGDAIDGRADLYALGVTLYLAATGRYPFEPPPGLALVPHAAAASPLPVRTHAPLLPDALADAIDRCLAPRPHDRFDTAHDFVTAIERTPAGDELPREAREVRTGAMSTMALLDWTVAFAITACFLVLGERSSIGRAISTAFAQLFLIGATAAATLRGIETMLSVRRALSRGVAPADLVRALAPAPEGPLRPLGAVTSGALLVGGCALALAQAQVSRLALPDAIELAGNLLAWLLPPTLIQRGLGSLRHSSGASGWWYRVVRQPIAQRIVRWLGGRSALRRADALPASEPTEVLLGQAAEAILARLPAAQRGALQALPATARQLADDAMALRVEAQALSGKQRALRATAGADRAQIDALEAEQAAVRGRLGTTIAALESIRLDLLRLEASQTLPGTLTDHLEVVRDLQRRVDANADVRALLQDRYSEALAPEPTPV
jgi:serine/threonine-protein kinase